MKIVLCYQNNIANCIVTLLKTETQGIIGFLIISTVVDVTAPKNDSVIIGFLIISTVVDYKSVLHLCRIIGFLIISTVVDFSTKTVAEADNWFPYNFYCCR